MLVTKRSGKMDELDIRKIQKVTGPAVKGLENVSQSELEVDANIQFQDGMKTSDIHNILVRTAVDKIDIDKPHWTFVAARLFIYDIYHKVWLNTGGNTLRHSIEACLKEGKYQADLMDKYDVDELDAYIQLDRDLQFTYLGIKTLNDRYIIKNKKGEPLETPQTLFMGVAMFLAQNEEDNMYWAKKFYDIMSRFEVMPGTPTLSNARTPRSQCSSCYIGSTPDNIEGIFNSYKEMALLSKFGGGIGWDWNNVRGMNGIIDGNSNVAGGIVPFLKITNDLAIAVDQLGTRKGAIAVYVSPWHIDIRDFLDLRKNSGDDRRRAHELFPAIWMSDLFMERVENDEDWTLIDPNDAPDLLGTYGEEFREKYEMYEKENIPKRKDSAKALWKTMLREMHETGMPFLGFKDEANRRNPNNHVGVINSSNLCTEIFQNTSSDKEMVRVHFTDDTYEDFNPSTMITTDTGVYKGVSKLMSSDVINSRRVYCVEKVAISGDTAVCNLASVNLSKINTEDDIARVVPTAIRMLDNVIDLNFYPVKKVKDTNLKSRSIGLGVMGEHHMLVKKKIMYGSQEHMELIDEVLEDISYTAIEASMNLSKEKGSYKDFKGSMWSKGILPIDTANKNALTLTTRGMKRDWESLREDVKEYGIRNGYLMAIAPTSSISILTGTSQTIEAIYKRKWYEENLSGHIPVVAPDMSPDTWRYYTPVYELNQTQNVLINAVRQKWIDQGISFNVFMSLDKVSGKYLNEVYTTAWKFGLKSTYYLRSESPAALEDDEKVMDRSIECTSCQ